jgi:hypothetical protein
MSVEQVVPCDDRVDLEWELAALAFRPASAMRDRHGRRDWYSRNAVVAGSTDKSACLGRR